MKRALVFVNCHSRGGTEAKQNLADALSSTGIQARFLECEDPAQLSARIVSERKDADFLLVAGGDGTINAAAAGVVETQLPLAILPCGTANDLARTLSIPTDVTSAIALVANGYLKSIDLGQVNDRYFFNVASVGMSASLAAELTSDIKKKFGRLGYALTAAKVLMRAKPLHVEIIQGAVRKKTYTLQVAIGNGRFYGGGNVVEKSASIDDGMLDLYSLEFAAAWRMIFVLRAFAKGEHGAHDDVRALRGAEFELRTRRPRPINADGEIVTQTPARFRVLPAAVQVFVAAVEN